MRDELTMNHRIQPILMSLLLSSLILHPSSFLRADGGTVRLSEQKGNYRIAVLTAPAFLRAGPVDISVLIQDASTGEPVSDVDIAIKAVWCGAPAVAIQHSATTEAATNKLYYAATFELPEAGWYALDVSIAGARGAEQVHFDLEIAEPLPPYLAMWPSLGWPLLAILLFAIHQFLVKRRSR
jgi:hypothetical protein